ncbi:VCBS repeat-containing protein [Bradyrhizobium sp. WSM 1738]|uniref:FG-GAP repeat domain-containing protein n=1 Tax=Bradyrhizobium hereditatis TaxID=2821405 RepID=UPI001CE24873|nr:VCBS repeat-containing protein [Bradyrhizobium hereditatis]MCA6117323.1 VCBS repeat-containing protein [Bradyrhizobium hereditatis]
MLKRLLLVAGAVLIFAAAVISAPEATSPRREIGIGRLPGEPERIVRRCDNEHRVQTSDHLEQVLRSNFVGCVIVAKDKFLNMTGRSEIPIRGGVTLMGERGELGSRPSLFTDAKCLDPSVQPRSDACKGYSLFVITENNISVTGLHLRGPAKGSRSSQQPYIDGITITADPNMKLGRGIYIAENEFDEWTGSAVGIGSTNKARTPEQYQAEWTALTKDDAGLIRVDRNFFHHNARDGGGYGVTVGSGAFAAITGNVFDFNRHAVASDGFAKSGYIARFNYVLQGGFMQDSFYNQHFDVHGTNDTNGDNKSTGYGGTAGDYYEIAYNTIRGAQEYACVIICLKTRPALMLRGKPTSGMRFDANVVVHGDLDAAVSLKMEKNDTGWGEDHGAFSFSAAGNQFGTDRSDDLATGDFDGDGRTDVLVATGTAWFFSPGGQGAWEFLHASDKLTRELGFADIDNDGFTDVLYRDGAGNLGFVKSGRVPLQPLTTTPEPLANLRFGDFDGDDLTDIFYTRNGRWWVWYGRLKEWQSTQSSGYAVSDFLFGEFDAQKGTDVAVITGGKWQISSGATGSWTELNSLQRSNFRGGVVADFDGDGRSDIAFDDGSQMWSYSPGGAGALRALREGDGQSAAYPELSRLLVGYFDGDRRAKVVSYYVPSSESMPAPNHFMIWRGGLRDRFEKRSWHAMR